MASEKIMTSPIQEPILLSMDVPLSPKILSPNPYFANEVIVPQPNMETRKAPSRRNISETSLDFSLLDKKSFDLGFETAPIVTPIVDFIPDPLVSSIIKQNLDEQPLISLLGEKRLKNCDMDPLFKEFSEEDKLDILNL